MKILAIILARKGSGRLKNKNKKKFGNKPLFMHTVEFAKSLSNIENVIFSSDCQSMLALAKKYCLTVKRPKNLSSRTATSGRACLHALNYFEKKFKKVDSVILLQPTTPFRRKS